MLERIRVDHFEEDPFVARQPLTEDTIAFAVVHGSISLDPRLAAIDERLGASTRVGSWDFDSISSVEPLFSYTSRLFFTAGVCGLVPARTRDRQWRDRWRNRAWRIGFSL